MTLFKWGVKLLLYLWISSPCATYQACVALFFQPMKRNLIDPFHGW